ncbi:MAG: hypothetical protein M1823_004546 [Watsoniomyces obsoletus]|nr:MAG: hypothetical protein M1823_004546 [Watsoniomyces obsoletus]
MASEVPANLKSADIARFAHRAAQVEKVKPAVAYWCYYWITNQILSKGLHLADGECTSYTTKLLEKLEQMKAQHADNDAIMDDVAGQAYMQQFGLEVFNRADKAIQTNKVTRQTADTFQAAATFLEVLHTWEPVDPEIAAKIRYAKYHAVRIARAIKANEDPNLSNPPPQPTTDPPPANTLDNQNSELEAQLAMERRISQEADQVVEEAMKDVDPGDDTEAYPPTHLGSRPSSVKEINTDYPSSLGRPDIPDDRPLSARPDSRDYFPHLQPSVTDTDDLVLPAVPSGEPTGPGGASVDHAATFRPGAADPSGPGSRPDLPMDVDSPYWPQPAPSQPPDTDTSLSSRLPDTPSTFYSQPIPPRQPVSTHSQPPRPAKTEPVYATDEEAIMKATKHAKWAISALNFEDVTTAVRELKIALESLEVQQ